MATRGQGGDKDALDVSSDEGERGNILLAWPGLFGSRSPL